MRRTSGQHRPARFRRLALALPVLAAAVGATPSPASAAGQGWMDGKSDADTIIDCITQSTATGTSANAGMLVDPDRIPAVGERFWVRVYAGLVGLPCHGKSAMLPEFIPPTGVEFAVDDANPITYGIAPVGQQPTMSPTGLVFDYGVNGGLLVGVKSADHPNGGPFILNRDAGILEIRVPMVATRALKGKATQEPECEDRRKGRAPCKVDQAGDHLQVAVTVEDSGDKQYVIPYVGLFANPAAAPAPAPAPAPGPAPAPAPAPAPGAPGGGSAPAKAKSSVSVAWKLPQRGQRTAVVTVRSASRPTGTVTVLDGRRVVKKVTLTAARRGKVTVKLPALTKGRHVLTVKYSGSATVLPSASRARSITLR
ncbi:Ig-like domain-containing protein [Motilibacter aurantiacus]|uniref:Ig-like domain-containing protein n=1 Tax=Motilibacter aurantiacus TaxID=2714955 RepID=UPI00140C7E59|nr:Ig-like domain-containing protein [Motilibacter aurantiacus]NHC44698.1 Ig-like domain repeat protein [Motilibacter aurantiacus]